MIFPAEARREKWDILRENRMGLAGRYSTIELKGVGRIGPFFFGVLRCSWRAGGAHLNVDFEFSFVGVFDNNVIEVWSTREVG